VTVTLTGRVTDDRSGVSSVRIEIEDEYGQTMPTVVPVDGAGGDEVSFTRCFALPGATTANDADGRDYTITAVATDLVGNSASEQVHVHVRKHKLDVATSSTIAPMTVSALRSLTRQGRSTRRPATTGRTRHHDHDSRTADRARRAEGNTL
jgi:hypothetical protein